MPAAELKVTLTGNGVTIVFNDYDSGTPVYILRNTARLLSKLSTRQSVTPKQAAHGVNDGLSHDDARTFMFEGEIQAASQSDCKTKETNLRRCVALPAYQGYSDDDGYILAVFEDEAGNEFQCYAKVVSYPEFDIIDNTDPSQRSFEFVMFAKDPTLYSTTLTTETGPESVLSTTFQIQDGALPSFMDGELPTIQDDMIAELTVTNNGTTGTPPIITIHGPCIDPIVTNTTTGKVMALSNAGGLTVLEDERVEIDVAALSVTHFDDAEAETDVSAKLTAASEWIFIEPGSNLLTLLDDSPGELEATLEVDFRDAWK